MTDLKFNILKVLYNSNSQRELSRMDIFNSLPDDKVLIHNALKELQSKGIIKNLTCSEVFKLTELGAELFEQEAEYRKRESKHKIQYIIGTILTVATLLSTIFLSEPFIKFITWLSNRKS